MDRFVGPVGGGCLHGHGDDHNWIHKGGDHVGDKWDSVEVELGAVEVAVCPHTDTPCAVHKKSHVGDFLV